MRKKIWHCKSCGRICDSSNSVCPDCGLDLAFYGEIQFVETSEPESPLPSGSRIQEQTAPSAREENKPEIKEEHKAKENKPKTNKEHKAKESKPNKKGKGGKVLILTGVVLMAALGCFLFMNKRKVESIRFESLNLLELESGSEEYLFITVNYTGFWGPRPKLTATSSNSSVIKVLSVEEASDSENGSTKIWMECGKPGTADLTVKAGDKSNYCQIPVYQITGVELDIPEGLAAEEGVVLGLEDSVSYTASVQYTGEIYNKDHLPSVKVSSSDTDIVEVDSKSGKLIAKGYGTAVVTASVRDYETSIPVSVFDVTDIELQCYDLLVDGEGKTISWIPEGLTMGWDIYYHYNGPNLKSVPYTLESSNEEVLSVDPANFTITAVGPGEATITASMGSLSDSITLEVYPVDRSTGSWVKGSIQTIAAPAEDSSSKAAYTITIHYGDDVHSSTIPTYFGTGGILSNVKSWEKVEESDRIWTRETTVTLQGSKWEQRRNIAGITFLFKRESEDSNYNPATDLLDYWVIYTE